MDFAPIDRETCDGCKRPLEGWFDKRAQHMASAFRSGVPAQRIANAYGISGQWAMKIISEQMGKEAVRDVQQAYWATEEESNG